MKEVIQQKLKISVSKNTKRFFGIRFETLLQISEYNVEEIESDLTLQKRKYGIDIEIKICQLT